eukprot:Hpha_TRINITY_DN9089_c0_g1::TRINITY_DN9089_c0_g1_i1::g.141957::m.141957
MAAWVIRLVATTFRSTDTPAERDAKIATFPMAVFGSVLGGGVSLRMVLEEGFPFDSYAQTFAYVGGCLVCSTALINLYAACVQADRMLRVLLLSLACIILLADLHRAASLQPRWWPFLIVVLDIALSRSYHTEIPWMLRLGCIWHIVIAFESAFRAGIYSVSWHGPVDDKMWSCADPPCAVGPMDGAEGAIGSLFTFLFDYYYTYNFANGMQEQNKKLQAVVDVSAEVTAALARMDVAEADSALERSDCLPDKLRCYYQDLVKYMSGYKSSLPLTVLEKMDNTTLNTADVTVEQPQFERLQKLFLSLLKLTSTGLLREMGQRLRSPLHADGAMRILTKRAMDLKAKVVVLRHLDPVLLLALQIYTMEGPDIDRAVGFDDAPEWIELEQFCQSAKDRQDALALWKEHEPDAQSALKASEEMSHGVHDLIVRFSDGLLDRITTAKKKYWDYRETKGVGRNPNLYKVLSMSLRTIQQAEGSVPDFVAAVDDLVSQGLLNFIGALCCCTQSTKQIAALDESMALPYASPDCEAVCCPLSEAVLVECERLANQKNEGITCYRGLGTLPPEVARGQRKLRKGQFVGWVPPTSVSLDADAAREFMGTDKEASVFLELRGILECIPMQEISQYPHEQEVLIPPFSRWEVIDVVNKDKEDEVPHVVLQWKGHSGLEELQQVVRERVARDTRSMERGIFIERDTRSPAPPTLLLPDPTPPPQ